MYRQTKQNVKGFCNQHSQHSLDVFNFLLKTSTTKSPYLQYYSAGVIKISEEEKRNENFSTPQSLIPQESLSSRVPKRNLKGMAILMIKNKFGRKQEQFPLERRLFYKSRPLL